MSSARLHRQGLKIAQLKEVVKDLEKRLRSCKDIEDHIQDYLKTLENASNSHFQATMNKVESRNLQKVRILDNVTTMVNRLSNMWNQLYQDDAKHYGRQFTDGKASPTGSSIVTDWDTVDAMIDTYIDLLDCLRDMLEDENAVLNQLFNQVSRNWTNWYRHQKSLRF